MDILFHVLVICPLLAVWGFLLLVERTPVWIVIASQLWIATLYVIGAMTWTY